MSTFSLPPWTCVKKGVLSKMMGGNWCLIFHNYPEAQNGLGLFINSHSPFHSETIAMRKQREGSA